MLLGSETIRLSGRVDMNDGRYEHGMDSHATSSTKSAYERAMSILLYIGLSITLFSHVQYIIQRRSRRPKASITKGEETG